MDCPGTIYQKVDGSCTTPGEKNGLQRATGEIPVCRSSVVDGVCGRACRRNYMLPTATAGGDL